MNLYRGIRPATLLLCLILLLAASLRLRHINQPLIDAFSWRESSTAMMAENFYRKSWNIFYPEVNWTGPGPSYQAREFQTVTYISALLYLVCGQNDWVGRAVAVVFGLLGILALYKMVCRVWDMEHGIAAAAAMAVLPGSIFVERSFLPDPAMVALVTTSLWLLVVYLQEGRLRCLLAACAIGLWALLTKLPAVTAVPPMIYAFVAYRKARKLSQPGTVWLLSAAALLTILPVILYYSWALHLAHTYPPHHIAGSGNWLWDARSSDWWSQGFFLPKLARRLRWLWAQPALVLVGVGMLLPPLRRKASEQRLVGHGQETPQSVVAPWLFHMWFFGVAALYVVGAQELVNNPWNLHVLNPAAAALSARAAVWMMARISRAARHQFPSSSMPSIASLVTAALVLVGVCVSGQRELTYMYHSYAYQGYEMGRALRELSHPSDLVVTVANDIGDPVAIYYSHRRGWVFPPAEPGRNWVELPADDGESIRLFEGLRNSGAKWLGIVDSQRGRLREDHPLLVEHINRTCVAEQESPEYVVYRVLPPGGGG